VSNTAFIGADCQFSTAGVNKSRITSVSDGTILLRTSLGLEGGNDFYRLQFGSTSSSFPAIKRNGTGLDITDAADTGFTDLRARNITAFGSISATGTVFGNGLYFSGLSNTGLYANINSVFIQSGTGLVRFFNGSIRVSQTAGIGFSGNVNGGAANNASINWMSPGVLSIGAGDGAGRTDGSLALTNLSAFSVNLSGDIEVTDPTKGVILKSPNGTRFRITVTNSGALSTTQV
jgi:hypothetical protein